MLSTFISPLTWSRSLTIIILHLDTHFIPNIPKTQFRDHNSIHTKMSTISRASLLTLLATIASAYTPPTTASWGPLLFPSLSSPVTQGQSFTVTWDPETHPTTDVTVSLVLCHGPSTNCVDSPTAIVENIPAAQKSYSWDVPCSLSPGTASTDTGYGMLVIVDGTGEFQYSTQFSVLENPACGGSASSSSVTSAVSSSVAVSSSSSSSGSAAVSSSVSVGTVPGYPGWGNSTMLSTLTSAAASSSVNTVITSALPTSLATATSPVVGSTTAYPSASPPTASPSPSSFTGEGVRGRVEKGVIGVVVGLVALAVL